jgi:hypothetical protein
LINIPPSHFVVLGQPLMSRWGKTEIEMMALAYVTALMVDGDRWRLLLREEVLKLLPEGHVKRFTRELFEDDYYARWFGMVAGQLTNAEGAIGVGGTWATRHP